MLETKEKDFSYLDANFKTVKDKLSKYKGVTLLAATKTVEPDAINYAIDNLGLKYIGENRVQELCEKYDKLHLGDDINVHFIGSLQVNKVKYIVDKVSMIHSLDSEKLAREIDKRCGAIEKVMDVLIEVNVADEENKGGLSCNEVADFYAFLKEFDNLRCVGLMTMAPAGCTDEEYMHYFGKISDLRIDIMGKNIDNIKKSIISMGMSDTYELAAKCGSDMVRIGSALFGNRNYTANR